MDINITIIRSDATPISSRSDTWEEARLEVVRLAARDQITNSDAPVFMCDRHDNSPRYEQHTLRSIRKDNDTEGLGA